ncbi:MAG TPA: Ig-like domain-containing protein, partial [Thermomicrobiales bacterium]|nr:Ig-like domain-containing protein [Thermomicrobiales bacterium]
MCDETRDVDHSPSLRSLTRPSTRRQFLGGAVRLGAGAAGIAAFGRQAARPQHVLAKRPEHVEVLIDDVSESTRAQFSRGQSRGATIHAHAVIGSRGDVFTSGPVQLPFAATHLGLHWITGGHAADAFAVDVRTSRDGRAWTAWQSVTIEAAAEASPGQELFGALVAGQRGTFAQYRTTFQSDEPVALNQMTVTSINTDDGPALSTSAASASVAATAFQVADGSSISIVTREGWGCDEGLRFRGKNERWPEMYVPAKKVVIHHTATSNTYVDGAAEVRAIYTYHARTLGWGDIGYNLLVDRFGAIYEGRHGRGESSGREIASADVVAGHVLGHNYGSTGIAAIGHSSASDWESPPAMLQALEDAATYECGRHFIDPTNASDFLKSDGIWHPDLDHCSGHSDSFATECPGSMLYGHLGTLRLNVADRLNGGTPPALEGSQTANSLSFTWSSPDGPYLYCLEGWHKPSNSEDITYLSGYEDQSEQWNDPLARAQAWTATHDTSRTFPGLASGHYTMHVRTAAGTNADRYEANLTYLIDGASADNPPSVTLQQPADGSTVSVVVTLVASATDDFGVSQVEFFANGVSLGLGSHSAGTWSLDWDTTTTDDGPYTVTATATDTASQTASHSIDVTVSNETDPPAGDAVHVGDLDRASMNNGSTWTARVTATAHDAGHAPVSGATVSGAWGGGASGTGSGTT